VTVAEAPIRARPWPDWTCRAEHRSMSRWWLAWALPGFEWVADSAADVGECLRRRSPEGEDLDGASITNTAD
jgi:hypothetical protein